MKNKNGFTLGELLIVVTIIGVLVAISIPFFPLLTEYSKEKTDANYEAAAKTACMVYAVENDKSSAVLYYDPENGYCSTSRADVKEGYGQGTITGNVKESHENKIVACTIADGEATTEWIVGALNPEVGDDSPLYTIWNYYKDSWKAMVGSSSLDSGDTANQNTAIVEAYIKNNFPTINVTYWRVTNESGTYTITVTDVDLSKVGKNEKVKVIRCNPKKTPPTYTAAYCDSSYNETKKYYYIDLGTSLTWDKWRELGQTTYKGTSAVTNTKTSYSDTVKVYNTFPDTTTW